MTSSAAPGDTPDQQPGTGLRADAERNRCRILAAARRLYAREGLGVSMASIAREAGVGKATLSRRFATKEELVAAVFAERMDAYATAVSVALDDPDPWHGLIGYVHAICGMQAADRGFADVLTMTFPAAKALEARRAEAYDRLLELIVRAKDTGHLRDDFTHQDVVILLIANAGVVTATGDAAPDTWRRLVGHMLRSYAAPGAPIPPLPDAPASTALYRAMVRLTRTGQDLS
ncbi:TetR/AcrR family transcriptional regulator [Streptomyces coeruleorubidus]|uniref:TetR/AcrR family transcriptional regulator n=1 Tax=Streptomyces coeruleorubidus TaxID=116188 RepID=A0A5J6HXB6_STRC4|nr:TetR/AcrR family transcriptional regulator [Streptomyces coeruleorubidus]QEV23073.1 TetR/AcrR family transcriptional regulator [Streptomyces coeruleorubidus]GGT81389.1 TetR family transcriptional regulator [Streptomyces coeruleorubidus]